MSNEAPTATFARWIILLRDLTKIIQSLRGEYGEPELPPARGPFELVMWENACYLLPDQRRRVVFEGLRQQVGLTPGAILNAKPDTLLALAEMGGMQPQVRVSRWREIARIVITQFEGDMYRILQEPYEKARKALKQFPSIGDPGAEKILMFCGVTRGLPLESNGLRVLTRIGYGREEKNYSATYRSVQKALNGELPGKPAGITAAHLLLRQHGKEICKTSAPLCYRCGIVKMCAFPAKNLGV